MQKRVLVTGSSRGIGRAIALELGRRGWSVAVHYSQNREAALEVAQLLGSQASGTYACDLDSPSNASNLWQTALTDGPLHALVNNAGVYLPEKFLNSSLETYEQTMRINFFSPLALALAATKTFVPTGGKILNVASRVGFRGEAGAAAYAASKAALINLTRSLAVELAPQKIGVFGLAPGWVQTAMAREGMDTRLNEILSGIPLGRMASPEDCANVAAFLLEDASAYLSGQVIDINGASYFH